VTVFTGGCDGAVKLWNITQGASGARDIGKHDAPVKSVKFIPEKNLVITGSWDNTVSLLLCIAILLVIIINT
jgi:WD40 repeat protein